MNPSDNSVLRIGALRVDPAIDEICAGGTTIKLEPRTMRLLVCLARHAGQVVSVEQLLDEVWNDVVVNPDSVYQAVAMLRRVLGDDAKAPTYIVNVLRRGYRLVAPVAPWVDEPAVAQAGSPVITSTVTTGPIADKSIAVLPFVNISGDKSNEYFSDGLSEELINLLTKIRELRVPARTSSFFFKGKQATIAEIAKALGVAYVLEGSVRKSGNTIRITAQLVRVDDGCHVWSETFNRQLDDIFKVQDEIAGSVVKALKVSLLEREEPRATTSANREAYTLYLHGQSMSFSATLPADAKRAIDYLQQSLKLDPGFAPAWAALAKTLAADFGTFGTLPYEETHAQAHEAANQALSLDPALPFGPCRDGPTLVSDRLDLGRSGG